MAKIIGVQTREGDCWFYPANLSIYYIQILFDPIESSPPFSTNNDDNASPW